MRNSQRSVVNSKELASYLLKMVRPHLSNSLHGQSLVGLNERCCFLCYKRGQCFESHVDAKVQLQDCQSEITLQLDLNDLPEHCGGSTAFIRQDGTKLSFHPVCGSALLFTQDLLHEGSELFEGIKYTMRTNVMYKTIDDVYAEMITGTTHPLFDTSDTEVAQKVLSGPDMHTHASCLEQHGITYIPQMVEKTLLKNAQTDLEGWVQRKVWNADKHMGFDGNSGETFLTESEAFSRMVANPALVALVAAHFGTLSPHLFFERTYCIDPVDPYERRAFQWHHDGWGTPQLKVMILLSDVYPDGQCMHYCPGTFDMDWPCSRSRETLFADTFAESLDAIRCHGKAGDAFVFETAAVHRGVRNQTRRRDVMVLNFGGDLSRLYPIPRLHPRIEVELDPYLGHVFRQPSPDAVAPFDVSSGFLYSQETPIDELVEQDKKRAAALWHGRALGGLHVDRSRSADIRAAGKRNREVMAKLSLPLDFSKIYGIEANAVVSHQEGKPLRVPAWFDWEYPGSFSTFVELRFLESLHDDFDLPLRVHHPFRDQLRDNVITRLRDNDTYHGTLMHRIDGLDVFRIRESMATMHDLRQETEAVVVSMLHLLEESGMTMIAPKWSAAHAFASDLTTMSRRAPSDAKRLGILAFVCLLADDALPTNEAFGDLATKAFHAFVVGIMGDFQVPSEPLTRHVSEQCHSFSSLSAPEPFVSRAASAGNAEERLRKWKIARAQLQTENIVSGRKDADE